MTNYSRYNPPCKVMPVDFVEKMYDIVDRDYVQITQDLEASHLKSKVHKLSVLESELVKAQRDLAKAFTQSEYNELEDLVDRLETKITKLNQDLLSKKPEWMINTLRRAA